MYNKLKFAYTDHPFWDLPHVSENNILQTKNYIYNPINILIII